MIYISPALIPELRIKAAHRLLRQSPERRQAFGLQEEEERARFYIVITFKCPARCKFCLFVKTAHEIQDCSDTVFSGRVEAVLRAFPSVSFSFSITGGEPLLFERRVRGVLDAIRANTAPAQVRWIGFGTSGVMAVPRYLNDYPELNFEIHLSRHHYEVQRQAEVFQFRAVRPVREFTDQLGAHVDVRLTCNLIRGGVDSWSEIQRYLDWAEQAGIRRVTFRELNQIAGDASMYTQTYIQDYISYYEHQIVPLEEILTTVEKNPDCVFVSQDVRPFIYHERWRYGVMDMTFRRVDEAQLIEYNDSIPEEIDEVVLHPDGLVTGCWDRNRKILSLENHREMSTAHMAGVVS